MEIAFYLASLVALASTVLVVTGKNPVHALLCLIVSLLALSMVFFALGAPFAGVLEIIVYAGAIMVLFVFVVMMLNLGSVEQQERAWLQPRTWAGPALLTAVLLVALLYLLLGDASGARIGTETVGPRAVGIALYGPYLLAVELASLLLLAAMVTAWHLGRHDTGRHDK